MAYVSMRQTITVKRGEVLDDWGNASPSETFTLNCRIDEGWALQGYRSSGVSSVNDTFVSTARILLDKLADIRETDVISFTNEFGQTIERSPKQISVKRGPSGKPVMTEVVI
jgi:hypothetical protein